MTFPETPCAPLGQCARYAAPYHLCQDIRHMRPPLQGCHSSVQDLGVWVVHLRVGQRLGRKLSMRLRGVEVFVFGDDLGAKGS